MQSEEKKVRDGAEKDISLYVGFVVGLNRSAPITRNLSMLS